jgi:DNA invertase Pin-like site-specific DNA recombinase
MKEVTNLSEALRDIIKGKVVRAYVRVSSDGQEGSLPDQEETVRKALKKAKAGKITFYGDVASGTKFDRDGLNQLKEDLRKDLEAKKEPIVIVRDFQRLTRDPVHYGALWKEFRDQGVRIFSINENMGTGTNKMPDTNADLLVPILIAAGGSEVNIRKVQTMQGVQRAKEKGILQGSAPLFYPKDALEPRRELLRLLQTDMSGREIARRLDKSTSWVRKNRAKFAEIREKGGDDLLNEYIDSINLVRDFQIEKNEFDRGSRPTIRMKTVVRMVSGYLNNPAAGFAKPTRADLEEYYNNFNKYKKIRR